jgi:hypothetical protein
VTASVAVAVGVVVVALMAGAASSVASVAVAASLVAATLLVAVVAAVAAVAVAALLAAAVEAVAYLHGFFVLFCLRKWRRWWQRRSRSLWWR